MRVQRPQDQQVGGVEAGTRRPHPGRLPLLGCRCAPQRDEHRPVPPPGGERVEGDDGVDEFESPAQLPRRGAGRGDPDAVAEPGSSGTPWWASRSGRAGSAVARRARPEHPTVRRTRRGSRPPSRPTPPRAARRRSTRPGPGAPASRGPRRTRTRRGTGARTVARAAARRDDPARDGVRPPERLLHPRTLHLGPRPPGRNRCARSRSHTPTPGGPSRSRRRSVHQGCRSGPEQHSGTDRRVARHRGCRRRAERDGEAGQAGGRR